MLSLSTYWTHILRLGPHGMGLLCRDVSAEAPDQGVPIPHGVRSGDFGEELERKYGDSQIKTIWESPYFRSNIGEICQYKICQYRNSPISHIVGS